MPSFFLISPWGAIFWLVASLVSLTVHEFGHGLVAYILGDHRPKNEGRLTLLPFSHIDPLGLLLLLLFGVGWAKPVKFDPTSLRYPSFGSTLVALAGPLANLIMLVVVIFVGKIIVISTGVALSVNAGLFLQSFILINALFLVTNLIPLPPFDGSKIVLDLLQKFNSLKIANFLMKNGQYIFIGILVIDNFVFNGVLMSKLFDAVFWFYKFI